MLLKAPRVFVPGGLQHRVGYDVAQGCAAALVLILAGPIHIDKGRARLAGCKVVEKLFEILNLSIGDGRSSTIAVKGGHPQRNPTAKMFRRKGLTKSRRAGIGIGKGRQGRVGLTGAGAWQRSGIWGLVVWDRGSVRIRVRIGEQCFRRVLGVFTTAHQDCHPPKQDQDPRLDAAWA